MIIRPANEKDLIRINDIYNEAIPSETSTADTEPYTMVERFDWFSKHDPDTYPVFVADIESYVAAYMSFSAYRPRRLAMRYTAELSYFVDKDYRAQGIGTELVKYAINIAAEYNIKTLIAILLAHNVASIRLLEKFGFEEWGRMPGVADFGGTERDHLYYGLRIY